MLNNKTILITGGTGSFGKAFTKRVLDKYTPKSLRIYSRDELKQWEMNNQFSNHKKYELLRFFIGDVRDRDRLELALEGVDIVIHAAALKQIPTAEYNPMECIKTNIIGAQNLIEASLHTGVKKVIALSTDKAAAPVNLYGASKLCAEKLFIAANNIKGARQLIFSVVRYGNVMGSRGSVIPFFLNLRNTNYIPITDTKMTRFNITLNEATKLVFYAIKNSRGAEIYVPKLPSFKITDLAKAIAPKTKVKILGIRPGEKLHEEMVTVSDSYNTYELTKYFVILPALEPFAPQATAKYIMNKFKAKKVKPGFTYNSGNNSNWLTITQLRNLIKKNIDPNFKVHL